MYTVDYFIKKFEAIPEDRWTTCELHMDDKKCVAGHCGITEVNLRCSEGGSSEVFVGRSQAVIMATALANILAPLTMYTNKYEIIWNLNDGFYIEYQQPTPKQRILAALYDIKAMQQPVHEDITKSLAVLPVSETSDVITKPVLS